ncbi:hypothetical protein BC938DRAFT_476280 [Jimgerdemannia flammicorona]|uniref:Uncharacterized protein n=1 Tax=Jimgerdemannia flammicorona TaxID=994334 RepID=A0A433QQQ6_9FUNG|nr:hypothetical protein BC938DRAFT_476280 [Jimgerdemannia flammicorona]
MLFPSSEPIKFVRHGLCHLTCSETPWLDDVYESNELDQNTVDVVYQNTKNLTLQVSQETQENQEPEQPKETQETQETEENHYSERSLSPGCSDEDNEDRLSNISLFFESDVPDRKNLRCTLAEPFVRRALMFYFQQYLHTHSIYMAYLTEIMTSPALTAAARGSLLEWTIMTKIKENWIGKSLRNILEKSLQLQDCKPLPLWLNNSLKVQPFEEIHDESTVSAEDDTLPTFLSGQQDQRPNRALLPSAMAGPDGVCATTMKGVFVIFASALSTKHNIKGEKCSKNIKTTDVEMFYTKSDGQPYKFPQNKKAQYHSMRGRNERIRQLRRDGVLQGFLRIHFNIPKAAGNVRQYDVVKKDGRTDLILNVDLQFAQAIHLLDGPIADVLETLCVKDNKGDIE